MAFGLPEHYTRGAGTTFIGDRDLTTGTLAATGLEFLGDASELTLDPTQEFFEHMEHQTGEGYKDLRIPRMSTITGNLVLDNTGAANLKRFLRGKQTAVSGATVSAEAHVSPGPGKAIKLASPVSEFTSLTDADVTPVSFVAGTAYMQDGQMIYILDGGPAAETAIRANYVSAAHQDVDFFGEAYKDYYLFFQGLNTANRKNFSLELFKVSFDPATLSNLLGDEITQLTIAFEALYEPLQATANLGGFGSYITVD